MREILSADILFLSLCPTGKNGFTTIYKAEEGNAEFNAVTVELDKFDEEGLLAAVAWAPGIECSEGDFAGPEAVAKMAHSFLKNGARLDMMHDCEELPKDAVHVAESFIIQKGDPRFANVKHGNETVDVTGGWGVIIKINDAGLRKAYREGKWDGVSMYGPARVREITKAIEAVKENEMSKLNEEAVSQVKSVVAEMIAKALEVEPVVEVIVDVSKAPADLDLADPAAIANHAKAQTLQVALDAVKWDDPASIAAYGELVAASKAVEETDEQKAERIKLEKAAEAAKSGAPSNVGTDEGEGDNASDTLYKAGQSMAAVMNKRRGLK